MARARAFTLIELLVVVSIIVLLIAILLPVLGGARAATKMTICAAQFQQINSANQMFMNDNDGVFVLHRYYNTFTDLDGNDREEFWFDKLTAYTKNKEGYHCPDADNGSYEWAYDEHFIGYGYNSWFLGQHPKRNDKKVDIWTAGVHLPGEQVKSPAEQLVFADSELKSNGTFSLSLWWPSALNNHEAVASERHDNTAAAAFYDGSVRIIKDPDQAINPGTGQPNKNIAFWDPQQRVKP